MKCVGIIAEYNPFHTGHAYHIEEAKKAAGADAAVVVMSGSFVQRGEPACMDKFARKRIAIQAGADMIIELPDLISCACAERFALGGVRLLASTGIVDSIAFGSESGDLSALKAAAEIRLSGDEFRKMIAEGCSYPKAASLFFEGKGIEPFSPNDTLAVEYIRALNRIAPGIETFAVKRIGSYSSEDTDAQFASAAAIRKAWSEGRFDAVRSFLPQSENDAVYCAAPAMIDNLSGPILYALRSIGRNGIRALAEVSEGLENPIYEAALRSSTASELLQAVKTKRYTMARLKRILINALLGSTEELQKRAANCPEGLYIRVLGVRSDRANSLLSALAANASLPVVTCAKDAEALSGTAKEVFDHACRAQRLHPLAFKENRKAYPDFPEPITV